MEIKEIRKLADLTQQQMAVELDMAVRTIANWESLDWTVGHLQPSARQGLRRFAKKHGINIEEEK